MYEIDEQSIKIQRVGNGWVTSYYDEEDEGTKIRVYKDADENPDPEAFVCLLQDLVDYFGMQGSRYDAKRIKINIEPGDKYEGESSTGDKT